jgi:hypothetical protein
MGRGIVGQGSLGPDPHQTGHHAFLSVLTFASKTGKWTEPLNELAGTIIQKKVFHDHPPGPHINRYVSFRSSLLTI